MNTILVWSNNHFWLTIGLSAVFAFILSQVWDRAVRVLHLWIDASYLPHTAE
jgi:hypothetical protein